MKREWAPAYRLRKATLANDEVRRSLELAEEAISVDPLHRDKRLEVEEIEGSGGAVRPRRPVVDH